MFKTMNFSFILSGEGEYHLDGKMRPVVAPCVITQWPGEPVRYGPHETWEEWYLIYDATCLTELLRLGFAHRERPIWYLRDDLATREALEEMERLHRDVQRRGSADRIDRLAERTILNSLLAEAHPEQDPRDRIIRRLRRKIEEEFLVDHDFEALARAEGFSPATFRRRWQRLVGVSPRHYLLELRARNACRLLAETELSISEIALSLGFSDPFYFSRLFAKFIGMSATAYRNRYRIPMFE
ncbi:MAG: AraC family transcriptional regulator [Lentisphaeria bacterium]|jgi:AraC-like DNA-binding protein|nr:AraC family transcriptional regulator [Lentisphaeria bacterium]